MKSECIYEHANYLGPGIHLFTQNWCGKCRKTELPESSQQNLKGKAGIQWINLEDISLIYLAKDEDGFFKIAEYEGPKEWSSILYNEVVEPPRFSIFHHDPIKTTKVL